MVGKRNNLFEVGFFYREMKNEKQSSETRWENLSSHICHSNGFFVFIKFFVLHDAAVGGIMAIFPNHEQIHDIKAGKLSSFMSRKSFARNRSLQRM